MATRGRWLIGAQVNELIFIVYTWVIAPWSSSKSADPYTLLYTWVIAPWSSGKSASPWLHVDDTSSGKSADPWLHVGASTLELR